MKDNKFLNIFFKSIGVFGLLTFLALGSAQAETSIIGNQIKITNFSNHNLDLNPLLRTAENTAHEAYNFMATLGINSAQEKAIEIQIYGDKQKFHAETPQGASKESNFLGYFHYENYKIGVLHRGNYQETKRILRHEVIHHILHANMGHVPPVWFDEGIAELLSRDPKTFDSLKAGSIPLEIKLVLNEAKKNKQLVSLNDLFRLKRNNFYGPHQDLHYATSYVVAAYFLNQEGSRVFMNLLSEKENGAQWIQEKLGTSLEEFEEALLTWAINS